MQPAVAYKAAGDRDIWRMIENFIIGNRGDCFYERLGGGKMEQIRELYPESKKKERKQRWLDFYQQNQTKDRRPFVCTSYYEPYCAAPDFEGRLRSVWMTLLSGEALTMITFRPCLPDAGSLPFPVCLARRRSS